MRRALRSRLWMAAGVACAGLVGAAATAAMFRAAAPAVTQRPLGPGISPYADWTPPRGVPAPEFGVVEAAPLKPDPWDRQVAGYYYVDASHPKATDDGNEVGFPARPRRTIPLVLAAGSIVELHGQYDVAHTSPRTLVANGTREKPVFIRGASRAERPTIRRQWELHGAYVVLENLQFGPADATNTGSLIMLAPSSHVALRGSELRGNASGGGLAIAAWKPGVVSEHIVLLGNRIHDNGDMKATYDQDAHGINIGGRSRFVWVVDNEMARNSGDGIQINAGNSREEQATTHHIYVGRNVAHHNKQTGFWTKQAVDVIFSENLCYAHRPSNSSFGACMGMQYSPERVWFLFNHIHDSEFGIGLASDTDRGFGEYVFILSNVIHGVRHTAQYNPNTGWSQAAIMMAGGVNRLIAHNTLHDVDAGIVSPSNVGVNFISGNVISGIRESAGCHVFLEMEASAARSALRNTLFDRPVRLRWGSDRVLDLASYRPVPSGCEGCDSGPMLIADPANEDFRLRAGAPRGGVDRSVLDKLFEGYRALYGVDISADVKAAGAFDAFSTRPASSAAHASAASLRER